MRFARLVFSVLFASVPLLATATDPPHDIPNPVESMSCDRCHMGHNAQGSALTSDSLGITNLCLSCHNKTMYNGLHGFPWNVLTAPANPGVRGTSHNWSAPADGRGATAPSPTSEMGKRLDDAGGQPGNLTCSVCHDQHNNTGRTGGSVYSSYTVGTPYTASSGSATLTVVGIGSSAAAKRYLIQIVATNPTPLFKVSNDNGTSWLGCSGASWLSTPAPPNATNGCTAGTNVALNDPAVTVTFAGPFATTNTWQFHLTYPFLRISNVDSAMCIVCHQDRNMNHTRVAGNDPSYPANGTNVFSHPVGVSLNVNGGDYDRGDSATNNVLDANGALQTAGDGIASNDLKLGANNSVHCMSCHSPHNADSNSLTEMP